MGTVGAVLERELIKNGVPPNVTCSSATRIGTTSRADKRATVKLMLELLKTQGVAPAVVEWSVRLPTV